VIWLHAVSVARFGCEPLVKELDATLPDYFWPSPPPPTGQALAGSGLARIGFLLSAGFALGRAGVPASTQATDIDLAETEFLPTC